MIVIGMLILFTLSGIYLFFSQLSVGKFKNILGLQNQSSTPSSPTENNYSLPVCLIDNKQMVTLNKTTGLAANSSTVKTLEYVQPFADIVKNTNTKKVTRNLRWDEIELTQGVYNWDTPISGSGYADSVVAALPENKVIFKLVFTPKWASTNSTHPRYYGSVPTDMPAWHNFVQAAVTRYGAGGINKVKDWEVWNEPNIAEYWWGLHLNI